MRSVVFVSATALATFAPLAAEAAPCGAGTLADYINLGAGGCTVDDKLFSNFQLALGPNDGRATVPKADQIAIATINEPLNPGLRFTGNPPFQSPPAPSPPNPFFFSWRISFTVTVEGNKLIHDASLEFADPTASGNANSAINELLCLGGRFQSKGICANGISQASLDVRDNVSPLPNQTFDSKEFGNTYQVVDTQTLIRVDQGTPDNPGSAQFSSLTEQFSEVPETPTPLLLGAGVLGLLVLRGGSSSTRAKS